MRKHKSTGNKKTSADNNPNAIIVPHNETNNKVQQQQPKEVVVINPPPSSPCASIQAYISPRHSSCDAQPTTRHIEGNSRKQVSFQNEDFNLYTPPNNKKIPSPTTKSNKIWKTLKTKIFSKEKTTASAKNGPPDGKKKVVIEYSFGSTASSSGDRLLSAEGNKNSLAQQKKIFRSMINQRAQKLLQDYDDSVSHHSDVSDLTCSVISGSGRDDRRHPHNCCELLLTEEEQERLGRGTLDLSLAYDPSFEVVEEEINNEIEIIRRDIPKSPSPVKYDTLIQLAGEHCDEIEVTQQAKKPELMLLFV